MRVTELVSDLAPDVLRLRLAEARFCVLQEASGSPVVRVELEDDDVGRLADELVEFVFTHWQSEYLARRLALAYPYLGENERAYLALLTDHGVRRTIDPEPEFSLWREAGRRSFRDLCARMSFIHLDGVVRFRIRPFVRLLDEAADESVRHYLADQEFEQFVLMLRRMLESQPVSEGELHVYLAGDRVWICTPSGERVHDPEVLTAAAQVADYGDVNPEDLAMSLLITRAPSRVVLHDAAPARPWPSFSETVERVFLDRSVRCTGCDVCARLAESGSSEGSDASPSGASRAPV